MRTTFHYRYVLIAVVLLQILGLATGGNETAMAAGAGIRRPIDMMILIDNSCSMFPANQIRANCDSYGSDINFLRITGADLFLARLGFGEANESDYQLGVIEIGDEPTLIAPLQSIKDNRDTLAAKIAHPQAQPATRILPAIQKAYAELKKSSRSEQNVPAVVLITDGVPWPREGQSNAEIETLINTNSDVPLFVMLLQNKSRNSKDYEDYIKFWEQLQTRAGNIFVYRVDDANQIANTFNIILGQLQNTVPSQGIDVPASKPNKFFVNQYIQKLIITIIRKTNDAGESITIQDPTGAVIKPDEEGVRYFRGKENPIEVYSLGSERIQDALKAKSWSIISSTDVTVFIDREGAYQFSYITPATRAVDITNVYQVTERQTPSKDLVVHFNLLDSAGKPILEPQTIRGSVINPLGSVIELPTLASVRPDSSGLYEFKYDLKTAFPNILNQTGRFVFIFSAGISDDRAKDFVPVTSSRLIVDVGLVPYIRSIAPLPVACEAGQPFDLRVNVGDYSTAPQESLKVSVLYGSSSIYLDPKGAGTFSGDLTSFCGEMIARQPCSDSQLVKLVVRLDSNSQEDIPLPPVTREVEAQIISPKCTVTPVPSITPTPTPTFTPTPDIGLIQSCSGIQGVPRANSCLPWSSFLWIGGILCLAYVSSVWVWPWIKVRTVGEPPAGFILICREGKAISKPISLYELGRSKRINKITIGSDPKATIIVPGLKPIEVVIERRSVLTIIREPNEREPFAYLDSNPKQIRTSDSKIVIKVSSDEKELTC